MKTKAQALVGTSGYSYKHWQEIFYPPEVKQKEYLEYYCRFLSTVELNVTFYRSPPENVFKSWHRRTPKEFTFSLKGSRYITHIKRLKVEAESVDYFFERADLLQGKAQVVLWQTPPNMHMDTPRLKNFLELLKKHDSYRHAFEFRHDSWFCDETFQLLDEHGATICRADWPEFANNPPVIGPFIYIRRHMAEGEVYGGCYTDEQLRDDAEFIQSCLADGRDVYIYFNNDIGGWAVKNAMTLKDMLT